MQRWLKKRNSLSLFILSSMSCCAHASNLDGASLGLVWLFPFGALLGSIAIFPIFMPYFWHRHFGKIALFWTGSLLIPYSLMFGIPASLDVIVHALITEYLPFVVILFTLYTLSGGILIWGNFQGTPRQNTSLLAIGTLLAGLMGTTGAAMLLIRPLLKANLRRQHKLHVVIFFLFLVANIGGGFTPLGDPPLFLGFLKGVSFRWTVEYMFLPVLFVGSLVLILFYVIDNYYFKKEIFPSSESHNDASPVQVYGKFNAFLLLIVILIVLGSGVSQMDASIKIWGTTVLIKSVLRDGLLLLIALLSIVLTPKPIRAGNDFNWAPILEVAKLFAGIFITIAPVIAILHAGEAGKLGFVSDWVSADNGRAIPTRYFWLSGFLSAFLDNAPTYLVFFNLAHGDAAILMGPMASTLLAISMGSVFMGALTYIGNAPNFMVKAIAEQYQIKMPSFFGYMKWSITMLLPIFALSTVIFF